MEKELRNSQESYQMLTESISDIFFAMDKDLRYIYWNKASETLTGISSKDAIGKTIFDIFPDNKETRSAATTYQEVIKTQHPQTFINEYRLGGKTYFFEIHAYPFRGGISVFVKDITEHKKTEQALRESEARYKVLFTGAPGGMSVAELQTKQIRYANPAMCRMFGYTEEEFLRIGVADLHPKEFLSHVLAEFEAQVRGEKLLSPDLPCLRKDDTLFYADISAIGIILDGRKCILGFFTDITERKKAEEELKKSESTLREQKLALEQKNLALKEMIEHIERTKNRINEDIAINVDETLMPIVEKLKIKGVSPKYVKLLKYHLNELTSSFGRKLTQKSAKLTPREIEICNMIKGGLSSKDISELLNVSKQTIEKHRKNIRKKLGLSNKKVNLTSHLQKI